MAENGVQLVCFDLCGETFAFNMDYLVEIIQAPYSDITPYFSPIPFIRGKWNYRERTVYIIDLRNFFGLENSLRGFSHLTRAEERQEEHSNAFQPGREVLTENSIEQQDLPKSILVVNIREQIFGLLTDAVLQVVPLVGFYEYPGMISRLPKKYFAGITLINAELVLILAIEEFINDYELDSLESINH